MFEEGATTWMILLNGWSFFTCLGRWTVWFDCNSSHGRVTQPPSTLCSTTSPDRDQSQPSEAEPRPEDVQLGNNDSGVVDDHSMQDEAEETPGPGHELLFQTEKTVLVVSMTKC